MDHSIEVYDQVLTAELLANSVLSCFRAAHVGVPYQNLSDHRHYREWGPKPGRLFRLPWAMYERLSSHYHPFFFFHYSGHYASRGLLVLLRSLEYYWELRGSEGASYYWEDVAVHALRYHLPPMGQGEMVQSRGFDVVQAVESFTTLQRCQDAYIRLLELVKRRFEIHGKTGRIQSCVEIIRILNGEGYDFETLGIIHHLRRSLDPRVREWRFPTVNLVAATPRIRDL